MTTSAERIEEVVVVGGGDAGLIAALSLQVANPTLEISVVDDFDEPNRQVGKSTFASIFTVLHNFLEIDQSRFIEAVQPVWKSGIRFENWGGRSFTISFDHEVLLRNTDAPGFDVMWYRYHNDDLEPQGVEMVAERKTPVRPGDDSVSFYNHVSYHLETNRFATFLETLCEERGIELINDRITDVSVAEGRDHIESVAGASGTYEADLFVDSTGFARILMGELDNTFTEFAFPLDAAVTAKESIEFVDIVPSTVITAGDAGWFWQIDTRDYRDYGYVYSSSHISAEDATEELRSFRELADDVPVNHYEFESGMYDRAWVGNCVAVGDALGFVEPLESTAVTLNGILLLQLSRLLAGTGRFATDGLRETYNEIARIAWEDVYQFVNLHYFFVEDGNEFWSDMRELDVEIADYVEDIIEWYQNQGMVTTTYHPGASNTKYRIINDTLYHELLMRMGVASTFYETTDYAISEADRDAIDRSKEQVATDVSELVGYRDLSWM